MLIKGVTDEKKALVSLSRNTQKNKLRLKPLTLAPTA